MCYINQLYSRSILQNIYNSDKEHLKNNFHQSFFQKMLYHQYCTKMSFLVYTLNVTFGLCSELVHIEKTTAN